MKNVPGKSRHFHSHNAFCKVGIAYVYIIARIENIPRGSIREVLFQEKLVHFERICKQPAVVFTVFFQSARSEFSLCLGHIRIRQRNVKYHIPVARLYPEFVFVRAGILIIVFIGKRNDSERLPSGVVTGYRKFISGQLSSIEMNTRRSRGQQILGIAVTILFIKVEIHAFIRKFQHIRIIHSRHRTFSRRIYVIENHGAFAVSELFRQRIVLDISPGLYQRRFVRLRQRQTATTSTILPRQVFVRSVSVQPGYHI